MGWGRVIILVGLEGGGGGNNVVSGSTLYIVHTFRKKHLEITIFVFRVYKSTLPVYFHSHFEKLVQLDCVSGS